jgi:guanylate kinase
MAVQDGPSPIVICGPSGVGKSVLIKKLQEVFPNMFGFSVSHTTRGPRPGEIDGKDYNFTNLATMQKEVDEGKFIEYAHVHGNMYGTSKEAVEKVRGEGKICILDIDVQGAKNIYEQGAWAQTKFVFARPPSMEELERRLRGRGTETEEKVLKRLANARGEVEFSEKVTFFDFKFVFVHMSAGNIPQEILEFFWKLQEWYPTLSDLPPEIAVLTQFRRADQARKGVISRTALLKVLKRLDPSFTEVELSKIVEPMNKDNEDLVDYQAFLYSLFKDVAM